VANAVILKVHTAVKTDIISVIVRVYSYVKNLTNFNFVVGGGGGEMEFQKKIC